ncbi:hypothetical protein BSPWISOXPB_2673 [uncultured Gammaproteobacteria bacterium]|nr:hypothetical protein BSPWISOXPB_2673 [uncultured Gammaproteobacteria bacterium]
MFGEQLWTVENMRHYPSAAPMKGVHAKMRISSFIIGTQP